MDEHCNWTMASERGANGECGNGRDKREGCGCVSEWRIGFVSVRLAALILFLRLLVERE